MLIGEIKRSDGEAWRESTALSDCHMNASHAGVNGHHKHISCLVTSTAPLKPIKQCALDRGSYSDTERGKEEEGVREGGKVGRKEYGV